MYLLVIDFSLDVYAKQIKLSDSDEKLDIYELGKKYYFNPDSGYCCYSESEIKIEHINYE